MKLIGAALPRTGTMSIRAALGLLGVGKAYHMHEVFQHPGRAAVRERAVDGTFPDWATFMNGYAATLDRRTTAAQRFANVSA